MSCNSRLRYEKLNVNGVEPVTVQVHRYEEALFSIDTQQFENEISAIAETYHLLLGNQYLLPQHIVQLKNFVSDPFNQECYAMCMNKYPNLHWLETALSDGYRRYRYFYPATDTVDVYTYVSGVDWQYPIHFQDENTMVIGLDNYFGTDYQYDRLQIPQYISRRMNNTYLLPDIFRQLIISRFEAREKPEALIDYMISTGKTCYFLNILLPDVSLEQKIGYTKEQWQFCIENEDYLWRSLIENNLLFKTDITNIRSFILEAPFTNAFSQNSPGRIGQWIGWQIVTSYMQNNNDVTLQELMADCDYKNIFQKSGYKPKHY
jgi:hypothetical protein